MAKIYVKTLKQIEEESKGSFVRSNAGLNKMCTDCFARCPGITDQSYTGCVHHSSEELLDFKKKWRSYQVCKGNTDKAVRCHLENPDNPGFETKFDRALKAEYKSHYQAVLAYCRLCGCNTYTGYLDVTKYQSIFRDMFF